MQKEKLVLSAQDTASGLSCRTVCSGCTSTRCPVLRLRLLLSAYARATQRPVQGEPRRGASIPRLWSPISQRASYAVSGTDLAYAAISLRVCSALSGTDIAYAAIRRVR
eukprot:2489095-Rhodomonas_salina.2